MRRRPCSMAGGAILCEQRIVIRMVSWAGRSHLAGVLGPLRHAAAVHRHLATSTVAKSRVSSPGTLSLADLYGPLRIPGTLAS